MAHEHASIRPVRCEACAKPLDSPICCTRCGMLSAVEPGEYDYFELFGLTPAYEIDEEALRRRYLELARSVHPDVAGRSQDELRQRALSHSSHLNRAYETLRDRVSRAEYLLNRLSGPGEQDRRVPPGLLSEVMTLREEIDEAVAAHDAAGLAAIGARIATRRGESAAIVDRLSRSLEDQGVRAELRGHLNAMRYWSNLLDQLPPGETVESTGRRASRE